MSKLLAAMIAGAFAFVTTAALAQSPQAQGDQTPTPSVKAPTKAERAAKKEAKAKAAAARDAEPGSQVKAERKARNAKKQADSAATTGSDQTRPIKADTSAKTPKPTKAERQQDATIMQKNAGKAGQ